MKLNELVESLYDLEDNDKPDVLIANSVDRESLVRCFSNGTLVLNCTGPYRFLGEYCVSACIEARTHYMDICGEPQFMENMFYKYHSAAAEANVLILHGMLLLHTALHELLD